MILLLYILFLSWAPKYEHCHGKNLGLLTAWQVPNVDVLSSCIGCNWPLDYEVSDRTEVLAFDGEVPLVSKHLSPLHSILILEVASWEPILVQMISSLTCVAQVFSTHNSCIQVYAHLEYECPCKSQHECPRRICQWRPYAQLSGAITAWLSKSRMRSPQCRRGCLNLDQSCLM